MYNNYLSDSDSDSNEYLEITYDENNIPMYKLKPIIPKCKFEEDDTYCNYHSEEEICEEEICEEEICEEEICEEEFMKLFSNDDGDSGDDNDFINCAIKNEDEDEDENKDENKVLQKYTRLWIEEELVDKNIDEKWEQFKKYVNIVDHKINKQKYITENTSNRKFSLLFKKINEEHKMFKPDEYNLINKHIILQRRLEYFMSRHTVLLYRN
jgi:hypothetical protein